jgi:hypothetical protein
LTTAQQRSVSATDVRRARSAFGGRARAHVVAIGDVLAGGRRRARQGTHAARILYAYGLHGAIEIGRAMHATHPSRVVPVVHAPRRALGIVRARRAHHFDAGASGRCVGSACSGDRDCGEHDPARPPNEVIRARHTYEGTRVVPANRASNALAERIVSSSRRATGRASRFSRGDFRGGAVRRRGGA